MIAYGPRSGRKHFSTLSFFNIVLVIFGNYLFQMQFKIVDISKKIGKKLLILPSVQRGISSTLYICVSDLDRKSVV